MMGGQDYKPVTSFQV